MLTPLLRIRFRAMMRGAALLVRHEPLPCATAAGLLVAACVVVLGRAASMERCLGVAGLSVALVWLTHCTRADERFLRTAGAPHRRLYTAEYAAASVPASLLLLTSAFPWTAAAPFTAVLVTLLPAGMLRAGRTAERRTVLSIPGPADAFEWKAGLRSIAPGVAAVYTLAALLSALPAAPLAAVAVLALMTAGVYQDGEGWPMLEALDRAPGRFLRRKLAHAIGYWSVLAAVPSVLFLVRHAPLWPVLGVVLAGCVMLVTSAVLLKYALYYEGRLPSGVSMLGLMVITVSLSVPPVALFLLYRLWRMAVRNLDPYLYAFD